MENIVKITVSFQVVTLLFLMVHPNFESLLSFIVASGVFGLALSLCDKGLEKEKEIRDELDKLKSKVDGLSIAKGFGR